VRSAAATATVDKPRLAGLVALALDVADGPMERRVDDAVVLVAHAHMIDVPSDADRWRPWR